MPTPVSRTEISARFDRREASIETAPRDGVNLIALETTFQMICCRRSVSPRSMRGASLTSSVRSTDLAAAIGAQQIDDRSAHAHEIDESTIDREASANGPRGVEEVFDQPRLQIHVAADRGRRSLPDFGAARRLLVERPQPALNHVERRSQLVRECGEELVFQAIGGLGGFAGPPLGCDGALEIGVELHVGESERCGVGQRLERLQFGLGRLVDGRPVGADGGNRRLGSDRDHRQALDERRAIGLVRNSGVDVDVRDHRRLTVEHHPAGDARLHRESLPLPQGADRIFVDVVALAHVTENKSHPVGAYDGSRMRPDDPCDVVERTCEGERLDGGEELLLGRCCHG